MDIWQRTHALRGTQLVFCSDRSGSPQLVDTPTFAELGYPAVSGNGWIGFFGPAGMPPAVVDKLSLELRNTLARPDVRDQLVAQLPRYARFAARLAPLLNLRDKLPGLAWLSEK